jgi:D-glycero-D-manno-heptose 1,7-bisphosphate phosphatase
MPSHGARPGPAALFLDRDGVVNVDHGYVHRPDQVQWVPGIFDLARAAIQRGYHLVIVTNQAGIGRGLFTEADFAGLTDWIGARFAEAGAPITATYHCPYHPEHGVGAYRRESDWRKPGPGMLLAAARDHGLHLPGSVLVGDKETDIEAALNAGVGRAVLYAPTGGGDATRAHAVVTQLAQCVTWL